MEARLHEIHKAQCRLQDLMRRVRKEMDAIMQIGLSGRDDWRFASGIRMDANINYFLGMPLYS